MNRALRLFLRVTLPAAVFARVDTAIRAEAASRDLRRMRREIERAQALAVLRPEERALLNALNEPYRWMPDVQISKDEAAAWAKTLASPVGMKIDIAMTNWAQQQAQAAITTRAEDMPQAAGFARGVMAGWQLVKSLSRLANADVGDSETDPTTATAGLEFHQP